MVEHYDVVVVGAGLSGICAGRYLLENCPSKTFAIFEGRSALGGTWDLFQYPGIRSDSDMYTLGFSFFAWRNPKAIADGASILQYLHDAAAATGVDGKIRYGRKVRTARWSSETALWTIEFTDESGESRSATARYIWSCAGYYNYDHGYTPEFDGAEDFDGRIVHPQHWTPDIDWSGKRVVVIGSGATAVTLVPALADEAAHVTMVQRSPTYIISRPQVDVLADALTGTFGRVGYRLARWKNVFAGTAFYEFSRRNPRPARKWLLGQVRRAVGAEAAAEHFTPSYDPWDQRLCLIPDGDLYDAINSERASIVTGHIRRFVAKGVELESGEVVPADLIVTATGLTLQLAGGCEFFVDGERVSSGDRMLYKGTMLSGVPNAVISIGYTNASWTLKCELISDYVCRLIQHMDDHDYREARPAAPHDVREVPLIDFNSGYIQRASEYLPAQGERLPWRLFQNYLLDQYLFRYAPLDDGTLEFR